MCAMLGFSSCVTEDDLVVETPDCPEVTFSRDGNTLFANFDGIEEIVRYDWFVDGEFAESEGTSVDGDNQFSLENLAPGNREICTLYETPDCPLGVSFCLDIFIESEESAECIKPAFSRDGDTLFASFEGIENVQVYEWRVDGQFIESDGVNGDNQFSLGNLTSGTYEICTFYETPDCPLGVSFCLDIIIESECLDLAFSRDGDTLFADFEGIDTVAFYEWQINGNPTEAEGTANNGDNQLSIADLPAGTYDICIAYESPECPTGSTFCEQIIIEDNCLDLAFSRDGDTLFANFEGNDTIMSYQWIVDGDFIEAEGTANNGDNQLSLEGFDIGTYNICITYETPECPNAADNEFCQMITIQ